MAKIQQYSRRAEMRKDRILSCKQCKGSPRTAQCVLQEILTTYCDEEGCMEIINYTSDRQLKTNIQVVENIKKEINEEMDNKINFDDMRLGFKH